MIVKRLIAILFLANVAGCASLIEPFQSNDPSSRQSEMSNAGMYVDLQEETTVDAELLSEVNREQELDRIAMNLIFGLTQIPSILPIDTTIQISAPTTTFGQIVEARLIDAGYGIRHTTDSIGKHSVQYKLSTQDVGVGQQIKASLAIGVYMIEREYNLQVNSVTPASPIVVQGYDAQNISMNDDILNPNNNGTQVSLLEHLNLEDKSLVQPAPEKNLTQRLSSANFSDLIKQNMYVAMQSNYVGFFKDFEDVTKATLIFPNDSTRLTAENKNTIRRIIADMNPQTDIVSIIGCSHGRTGTALDNEALAVGRANVVKLELVSNDVEYNRVLDEGCWATSYHRVFPTRGVVVTLKRLKQNS